MTEDFHMLSQPLTTEEGFINEACINELNAAILNMPPDWERLASDPEWTKKHYITWRHITGYLAQWAVRQITEFDSTPFPPGLETVIGYLSACIRPKFDNLGWAHLTLCEINKMLHEILMEDKTFNSWNDEKIISGWLDLHALIRNVCISIRDETRASDAFDAEFEKKHGKL